MPITLITGPANAGKAEVVLDAVRRELAHGQEPLLVVPTGADVEHYLRELAGDGAALGARVIRFRELIAEAVATAGVSGRPLGALARERVIASVLSRSPLAPTGASRVSPGLVQAAGALIGELRGRRVAPARLAAALKRGERDGAGLGSEEIGFLYAEYCRVLERIGRLDGEQLAVLALDRLRRTPALWAGRPVAFYGFDDLAPLQIDAIETLGRVVRVRVTVSLTYEPGRVAFAGRASTFAQLLPLADEHRPLRARADYYAPHARPALAHLERSLFEDDAHRVDPGGAVRMLEGGGERAELELIARDISALLGEGMAPEEIALVMRGPALSADLLEEVFGVAGIPFALERRRPFGDTAIGRALIGLLRCAGALPAQRGGAELGDLLAWLRAPGLLLRPELADSLELEARRAGAEQASQARALWEARHWPLETIDQMQDAARRGPTALLERAGRELQWLFAAPRRAAAALLDDDDAEDARALSAGRAALADLRELALIAPELAPADGGELAAALERVEVHRGRRPSTGAVAVLDPLALRARRVKALFVSAMQEGVFPARPRPQGLLSEEERRRLAERSGLRLGENRDSLEAERYLFYAAVSRPEELLVLSWHVADDDGEPTARSLFMDDLSDLFDVELGEGRVRRPLGAAELAPGGEGRGGSRWSPPANRLSDERVLEMLRTRPWSASSLESWIGCPMRWFVDNVLRPGQLDPDPEPLARGGLAHQALNDTLEELRAETGSARITTARLGRARELLRESLERRESEHPLSVAAERRPAARRRLRADLERYLGHAAGLDSPLEPQLLEVGFGIAAEDDRGEPSTVPAYELAAGSRLRGRIDRVDVNDAGEAVVYDYKSSFAPAPDRWISDGKLQVALYMRAVEELFGLTVVGCFYQPLSGSNLRARGLLDGDSGVELDCVRGDIRDHDDVQALLEEALGLARGAVAEAAAGELEARPQTCMFGGGGCEFPTICRCER